MRVMVVIVLERLVLELLVDVFDVLALLVEVLEGVYGAPNVMLGVGTVNVESSCAKMHAMTIVQASHDKCLGGCAWLELFMLLLFVDVLDMLVLLVEMLDIEVLLLEILGCRSWRWSEMCWKYLCWCCWLMCLK